MQQKYIHESNGASLWPGEDMWGPGRGGGKALWLAGHIELSWHDRALILYKFSLVRGALDLKTCCWRLAVLPAGCLVVGQLGQSTCKIMPSDCCTAL